MIDAFRRTQRGLRLRPFFCIVLAALCTAACQSAVAGEGVPQLVVPPLAEPTPLAVGTLGPVPAAAGKWWQLACATDELQTVPAQLGLLPGGDGLPNDALAGVFAVVPGSEGNRPCCFVLRQSEAAEAADGEWMSVRSIDDKSLGIWEGEQPVLVYNFGLVTAEQVPENDARRTRSCYIHPLYGLDGEVLTDDFPRDHYHHHGVFWTWPHVQIAGEEYDLWADRGIRQRFVGWLAPQGGPVAAVIGVENGWFVGERKVMIERVWIRAYRRSGDARAVDIDLVFIPVDETVTLWGAPGKSYGGLTVRFAPPSPKEAVITVPGEVTTEDLYDTPLPWADFSSRFSSAESLSGAAVFVPPDHPDFPPTWLTRHYGPLCIGWPGVRPKTFPAGEPFRLSYRIWVHRGQGEVNRVGQAYEAYQAARKARFQSAAD